MTDKQKLFVSEYLIDFNATQAAIRAKYSEKTAGSIGNENLQKPEIREYIKNYIDETLGNDKMTLKREIIDKLREIAFSSPDIQENRDGEITGVSYKDSLKALELLGKYMVMFTDKTEVEHTVSEDAYNKLKGLYQK